MMLPASLMRRYGHAVTQAHPFTLSPDALKILDPDVVVFQLHQTQEQQDRIKDYRRALPKAHFVFEIDDLFWAVPDGSFHKANPLLSSSKSNLRLAARLCNTTVCTTAPLAAEMKKLTGMADVRVLRNQIPRSFISAALAGRRSAEAMKSDKPRVGWAGGIGHGGDLKIVREIMEILGDEVQWAFLGMCPENVPEGTELYPGVPFADYPRKLGTLNLDVALAPLEENDFNRCKSDLRVLEYAAAGFPVIASDATAYNDTPATRVQNRAIDWANAIRALLSDKQRSDAYAESLHEWAVRERCMDDHIGDYVQAYLPKHTHRFTPTTPQNAGMVVSVGADLEGVQSFRTIQDAWTAVPGADILYLRRGTPLSPQQAAVMIQALDKNASASVITNDGIFPTFGKFVRLPPEKAKEIEIAAVIAGHEPIPSPFPAGPCVMLAGSALARFGLPDEERFGNVEYAMADWGARCVEGGRQHVTVADTYVHTEVQLPQTGETGRRTLDHVSIWMPGFTEYLKVFQEGSALAEAREDIDLAFHALTYDAPTATSYPEWVSLFNSINEQDRQTIAKDIKSWETHPLISIVFPTYNTPANCLNEAIASVRAQLYPHWELLAVDDGSNDPHVLDTLHKLASEDPRIKVIERRENGHICKASNTALDNATGDWVVFLDHDDTLTVDALYMTAREVVYHPSAKFIYSDSDKIGNDGEYKSPYFTPDFSYELLLAQNYVTHLCAYRLAAVKALGGLREGLEGSQDWDLALRYIEAECGNPPDPELIRHIPMVLYHWRETETSTAKSIMAKPYALSAGRRAVQEHLYRTKQAAFVGQNPVVPIFNLIRFLVPDPSPKVTVIIPTKDNFRQLERCVGTLLANTIYANFDVMVLDNGSTDRATKEYLNKLRKTPKVNVISMPQEFNYAAFNNRAVATAEDAEFICLMNDDVEVIEQSWLNDMVGLAMREKVGAVGAKLLYPDNTVQQGGIIFSTQQEPGQCALHLWQRLAANNPGPTGRAVITEPAIAVGGACMVIRRSLWQEMGGMDEIRFPVDWNDVDLCLRLHKKGYRNIVAAQSILRHHEAQTKKRLGTWGRDAMLRSEQKLLELHQDVVDPFVNPNLQFHPHLVALSRLPAPKPWLNGDDPKPRVLVVNGDEAKCKELYQRGFIPFGATVEGHYLVFSNPTIPNARPIDLRGDTTRLEEAMQKLGISRNVIFCGIGDGTLGTVGYFTSMAGKGWNVAYEPQKSAEVNNDLEYYSPDGWRSTWERFLEAMEDDRPAAAA